MAERIATKPASGPSFYIKWIALPLIAIIVAGGIVVARDLAVRSQRGNLEEEAARGRVVLCTTLHGEIATRTITLPGEIHGFYETPIYAKISGYVKHMFVDKGSYVKAGQLVATIESPETDQEVRNYKSTYDLAKITDARNQVLVSQAVIPQQTADESHLTMLADLASWKQLVATQQYERVYAPFDGMITVRNLYPGALVATPSAANTSNPSIYQIATLKPLRVYVYLPQTYTPFVRDGDESIVTVSEYPSRDYKGSITRHPTALDQDTRTMLIEVDLPNEDLTLYPGMYANVAITIKGSNGAPRVPDEALIFNGERVYVPIVRDRKIHLVDVKLGLDDGIHCQVTRGLKGDETVALGLGQAVTEGELIRPLMAKGN
ncbi:MAG TPA: efflux RND transporter periplasmic adaptor subunit [Candidatus Binataceae bacterium]|jgi:RND family efflux transporter MFP subunit